MWAIEVSTLGVATQGRTKRESFVVIADAIESFVNKSGFAIKAHPGKDGYCGQGRVVPSIEKHGRLLAAFSGAGDFVLSESRSG